MTQVTTSATYKTLVTADLPDFGSRDITFRLVAAFFNAAGEEVIDGTTYTMTLDAAGNDDGAFYLPTPDNTGAAGANWFITLPSGFEDIVTVAYSGTAQAVSDLLAAGSTTTDPDVITAAIAGKANKVSGATADNLASLTSGGDLADSGAAAANVPTDDEKSWLTAGEAGGSLGTAAYAATGDFDAAGSAAAAQAAAIAHADALVAYQGALTRDFTLADLATVGDYGYRSDKYELQINAGGVILAQSLQTYAINRALSVRRENMLVFWPMREQAGNFIEDYTGNGRHAKIITGAVVGATGPGDGSTAIDTATAGIDLYSASLAAAFAAGESTVRVVCAIDSAGWAGGLQAILNLYADANNYVAMQKAATANTLFFAYKAGGTTKTAQTATPAGFTAPSGFLDLVLTISKTNDRAIVYINGAKLGSTLTGLGTWAGNIAATTACAGCFANTPSYPLDGRVSFVQIWNAELTAAEVTALTFGAVVGFGDSVTAGTGATTAAQRWLSITAQGIDRAMLVNSGISGTTLQNTVQNSVTTIGGATENNGRDTYASRITAYNPEYVFILYGLNDLRLNDVAFTAANYQNDLGEVIDGLTAAGVDPQKIVIGSPPYIPEASYALYSPYDGGSRVKHAQYVTAAAAVATAKSTKYIDVYQWMADNGGDTLISGDNIHPNDAGHAQIAAAFLSVL